MSYENLKKYQEQVVKLLTTSFNKKRLVHTYLFTGERGTYKKDAALYFASLLLCEKQNACGECEPCKAILNNTNPNVFVISPENDTIKKDQILALEREFSLSSNSPRVFIIEDIEKATQASANSLLKFLEEANENCYGILLTENINLVLPTIKSRSQIVNFLPLNRKLIYEELLQKQVEDELASVLSTFTTNLDEAFNLSQDEVILKIIKLAKSISQSWENEKTDNIILWNTEGKFMQELSKTYHHYFLDILITLQNDKIKYLLEKDDHMAFKRYLQENPPLLALEDEIKILEIVMALKAKIKYNINMDLAYMQMLINIKR
jgi:DNA polymerase-3 subunit delta'